MKPLKFLSTSLHTHILLRTYTQLLQAPEPNYSPLFLVPTSDVTHRETVGCWLAAWGLPCWRGAEALAVEKLVEIWGTRVLAGSYVWASHSPAKSWRPGLVFLRFLQVWKSQFVLRMKEKHSELWGRGPEGTPSGINLAVTLFPSFLIPKCVPAPKPIHPY